MSWPTPLIAVYLAVAAIAATAVELRRGRPPAVKLALRRDWLREARFLAQYGQGTCLLIAVLLILCLDPAGGRRRAATLLWAAAGTFAATHLVKHLAGRLRPGRERDGRRPGAFLGPHLRPQSWCESFPSSHASNAVAMSAVLAAAYPSATAVWWSLAAATAALRWLLDAHWLGDVLAGAALGLACGSCAARWLL